jgi:hypothetical protein
VPYEVAGRSELESARCSRTQRPVEGRIPLNPKEIWMLAFPRSAARAFRTVARKGVAGRPRGPAPPVVLSPVAGTLTFAVHLGEVVVGYRVPITSPDTDRLLLPYA